MPPYHLVDAQAIAGKDGGGDDAPGLAGGAADRGLVAATRQEAEVQLAPGVLCLDFAS